MKSKEYIDREIEEKKLNTKKTKTKGEENL
jgi:hypothetical protein